MFNLNTKFLVVDDFSTMRKIVKKSLTDLGFSNIIEAVDGLNAYQTLVEHSKTNEPIGFIISDWNMPNLSGIDLLRKCKSSDEYKNLPFILVTAESEQVQIVEAVKAGVSDYVVKPFTPAILKTKLENSFKKSTEKAKAA